ncbi:MAG TPA: MFS transporter, partial [Mycobacteriales bacterium]
RPGPAPARVDVVGVILFASGLAGVLGFLLSIPTGPAWPLLPAGPAALALLVAWERRVTAPFLDVRVLARNRPLLAVYTRFAAVNAAFYGAFYALPLWFEGERGLPPRVAGLLLLPLAGLGLLATPAAVRLIARRGPDLAMVVGTGTMLAGSLLLLRFGPTSPIWSIVLVCAVLGLPNGFCNLSLQSSLFDVTPPEGTGTAAGLYQTSRYLGAILSTSLLGVVFARSVNTTGLHTVATVMAVISAALLVSSVTIRPSRRR